MYRIHPCSLLLFVDFYVSKITKVGEPPIFQIFADDLKNCEISPFK